jgi:hypothetical protein
MKRVEKIAFQAMAAVLTPLGVRLTLETGGKHRAVVCTAPDGRWAKTPMSSSPRADDKSIANWSRQDACRIAREFGLMAGEPEGGEGRVRVHHARAKGEPRLNLTRDTPLRRDPMRDPWAALASMRRDG